MKNYFSLQAVLFRAIAATAIFTTILYGEESVRNPVLLNRADPWIIPHGDGWLWCFAEKDRSIAVYRTGRIDRLGEKTVVWQAQETGPASHEIWAPELHRLDDRWYVYFAASDGRNENHRAFVLKSETADPLGRYELVGPLYTGDDPGGKTDNRWAIDMTVFRHGGKRYAIWSGWQGKEDIQHLFIATLSDPVTISSARVRLCENDDYPWERTEERESSRGLHEGPQILRHAGRTFLIYSCGASWLATYKLGLLELVGDDPLDPRHWKKHPEPVFNRTESISGPGHACFLESNGRHRIVYHAKRHRRPGWLRDIFVQDFEFAPNGFPVFGEPVGRPERP